MGFIERLRQQKAAEWAATQERYNKEAATKQTAETERQKREDQERKFHTQRKQQAEAYFQESGVKFLISELGKIIGGSYGWLGDSPWSRRLEGGQLSSVTSDWRRLPILAKDSDSVSFGVVWDEEKIGSKSAPLKESSSHGTMEKWDELKGKFIAVETKPDGDIIFHVERDIIVPVLRWRDDKAMFDDALEQAYNKPRIQKYNGHFSTYFPDSGG